ncbi:PilN domain-containing protein [Rodentibacter haemolyticus]|uniref:Competence protein ComB n=1 Tax=Rodentibacter haemolyticus TaxID=2778911 RepID=A0ABX6UUU0_9PAST|nr:hypothetical protein [Rodentibacter haemolyticus]QPB41527.1 hypothetical protein IHV77_06090 [Rodentibacter haemolyticus]
MNGVNLLPWRLEQYRRLLFLFFIRLIVVLALALFLWIGLSWFQLQQREELNRQRQTFEQQKNQLIQLVRQTAQIKQLMQNVTELKALTPEPVEQILTLLPQFPLQQGELESLHFNREGIRLNGFCIEQAEFEAFHEFLSTHFGSVKLTQFKPEQGRLLFQFEISEIKTGEK